MTRRNRRAFTLIELLVVIGIILVLIAILLPAMSKVREQAHVAATQQEINQIAAAIERYHVDFGAYPGPVANSAFGTSGTATVAGQTITSTENLILALTGGLVPSTSGSISFRASDIGLGPMILNTNPAKQRRLPAYMDLAASTLTPPLPWDTTNNGKTGTADNPHIPEFIDQIGNVNTNSPSNVGMPIIYLRANVGAPGIASSDNSQQYNTSMMTPYGVPATPPAPPGSTSPDYASWTIYFQNPSITNLPRGKDGYLLICAGVDGVFGTKDDILSSGNP